MQRTISKPTSRYPARATAAAQCQQGPINVLAVLDGHRMMIGQETIDAAFYFNGRGQASLVVSGSTKTGC